MLPRAHGPISAGIENRLVACPVDLRGMPGRGRAAARVGAAGPFFERHMPRGPLDSFTQGTGLDEARVLARLDSLVADPDRDTIALIAA